MKIEIILVLALVSVFLIDCLLKKRKKSTSEIEAKLNKDKVSNETSVNKRLLYYISKRPKNLTLFSIFVFLSKLCIHYFLYAKQKPPPDGVVFYEGDIFYEEFVWHLENILTVEVKLFIPAFIFMCLMVWFFNDKIKAR